METISAVKFATLHNNKTIFYSHEELFDKKHLQKKIYDKKLQNYDLSLLDFNYWKDLILNLSDSLESNSDRV